MKKSTILKMTAALAILILGLWSASAQQPGPATVTDGTSSLKRFGINASGNPSASEYVDSLTTGAAKVKYVVWPDSMVSPSYVFPNTNLNSHFVWSVSPAVTSIDTAVSGYASNYAQVTFPSPGTLPQDYTLSVYEKANTGSCTAAPRSYTARLIAAPNVTGANFTALTCPSGADGTYTVPAPTATLTIDSKVSGNKQVNLHYTLTGPAGFTAVGSTAVSLGNNNTIDLSNGGTVKLTNAGVYTLTVVDITDRISTKSGITSTINKTYTFTLNRAPVTGPIYHLPNM